MIRRIWHGWTTQEAAAAYQRLLDEEIVPTILERHIPGLHRVDILRSCETAEAEVEFATIMDFDHWTAVETFAGPGATGSVVPAAARRLLTRFDLHSQHYELLAAKLGQPIARSTDANRR